MTSAPIDLGPIRAVVVFSDDPSALAAWYEGLFALRRIVDSPGFVGLASATFTLFVQRSSEGHKPGVGGIRPHFAVANCREAFARVVESGGRTLLAPTDTGGEWVAAVTDRDGNPLGLLESKQRGKP